MKTLPFNRQIGDPVFFPVHRVAGYRAAHGGHMNTDLVCSAGFQSESDKTEPGKIFEHLPVGYRLTATLLQNSHFFPVNRVATDGRGHASGSAAGHAGKKSEIDFFNRSPLELFDQTLMGKIIFRHNHNARGVFIQPVHDAGTQFPADAGQIPAVVQKAMDQRSLEMAVGGVDNKTGRLGEHNDILILMQNRKIKFLGDKGSRLGRRQPDEDCLPCPHPVAGFSHGVINENIAGADEMLNTGAGQFAAGVKVVDKQIKPLAGQVRGNNKMKIILPGVG